MRPRTAAYSSTVRASSICTRNSGGRGSAVTDRAPAPRLRGAGRREAGPIASFACASGSAVAATVSGTLGHPQELLAVARG